MGLPQIQTGDTVKKRVGNSLLVPWHLNCWSSSPVRLLPFTSQGLQQPLHVFCSGFIAVLRGGDRLECVHPISSRPRPQPVSPGFLLTLTLSLGVLVPPQLPFPCCPERRTGHRQTEIDPGEATFSVSSAHLFLPALWSKTCTGRHTRKSSSV